MKTKHRRNVKMPRTRTAGMLAIVTAVLQVENVIIGINVTVAVQMVNVSNNSTRNAKLMLLGEQRRGCPEDAGGMVLSFSSATSHLAWMPGWNQAFRNGIWLLALWSARLALESLCSLDAAGGACSAEGVSEKMS